MKLKDFSVNCFWLQYYALSVHAAVTMMKT